MHNTSSSSYQSICLIKVNVKNNDNNNNDDDNENNNILWSQVYNLIVP